MLVLLFAVAGAGCASHVPARPNSNPYLQPIRVAAERGDLQAQFELGHIYEDGGPGEPQDYAEAARWYRRAAEARYAPAQLSLGALYRAGEGVPRDDVEAAGWYQKAADRGNHGAQVNLAQMYLSGTGVRRDDEHALQLLRDAAAAGFAAAFYRLGVLAERGTAVPRDEAEALRLYLRAADGRYPPAFTKLAASYESGRGVETDRVEAFKWYRVSTFFGVRQTDDGRMTIDEKCDAMAKSMAAEETAEAERRANEWLIAHRRR